MKKILSSFMHLFRMQREYEQRIKTIEEEAEEVRKNVGALTCNGEIAWLKFKAPVNVACEEMSTKELMQKISESGA